MSRSARGIAVVLLMASLPACGAVDSLKARRIAREGNTFYLSSDFKNAIAKYREAIALDPETPNVYLNLGYALFSVYRSESNDELERTAASNASEAFAKHLERTPDDAKATTFRIKTLLRAAPSDPALADQAFNLFTSMLEKKPSDEEAQHYLVALLIDTKRYPQALTYFSKRLDANPKDVATMKILAVIAERSDMPDEAIGWYRKRAEVLEQPQEKASLYYELSTYLWNFLHYQPEKTGGAAGVRFADLGIEAAKRAISLKADYGEAHVYANLLYLERAAREPTEFGREVDQRLAYDFRTKAAKMMGNKAKEDSPKEQPTEASEAAPAEEK